MSLLKLVYEKMDFDADKGPQVLFNRLQGDFSALLQSGGDGRYSYIVYDPFIVSWSENNILNLLKKKDFFNYKKSKTIQIIDSASNFELAGILDGFELKGEYPVPFTGGAVGYLSYDYGCGFSGIEQRVYDELQLPDYAFNLYDKVIAFDHKDGFIYFLAVAETDLSAKRKIDEIKKDLSEVPPLKRYGEVGEVCSNISENDYIEKVERIKDLLRAGETYQVNFSQRFKADCSISGWEIYKKLWKVNPAPFACYMDFSDYQIISSSPELLYRKRGDKIETWPIKGTVKRGGSDKEDESLVGKLIASEKDEAELSMIVDLERNDLGKICEIGSVEVDSHREIQKCSHVIHTYSRIHGRLARNSSIYDCLKAVFPSGSITGCPKKRTMEIIDRFEDFKRGVYTGSAGFFSFSGDIDLNILIRTILLKQGAAYFNSGGGIVIDSDPKKEYKESLMKARALIETLK